MAEAGIAFNYVALHFDFHETTAYQIYSIVSGIKLSLRSPKIGQTEKKLTLLEDKFIHITSRRDRFLPANHPFCWTSRNCVWYASIQRNRPEPSPMHVEDGQNIDISAFSKHFMKGTPTPYKLNLGTMHARFGIQKECNRIYCKNLNKFVLISMWISVIIGVSLMCS